MDVRPQPKIDATSERLIVTLLDNWSRSSPLGWEPLRLAISSMVELDVQVCWSRQSLSANARIKSAFRRAKTRLGRQPVADGASVVRKLALERDSALEQLAAVTIQFKQLMVAASQLPGGMRLILEPLPTNTTSQTRSSKRSGHRK